MYPPAPRAVSSGSAENEVITAATAASTALPPAPRTSAPARAVSGWPAATTPRAATALSLGDELRDVELGDVQALARTVALTRTVTLALTVALTRLALGGHTRR